MSLSDVPAMPGQTESDSYNNLDDRRQKEFYKYYDPIRALSEVGPAYVNLWDPNARAKHCPRSISDRALTAFCQLAALRLKTRRALLFFFDKEHAYVLAEATKSISLQDDNDHEIEDELWLGHTIIPRGLSVCETTVNIALNRPSQGSNSNMANAGLIHIINDLRDDTRFCDRPFVTEEPRARFYAGVPITTPLGINIGAFCVLDDEPRDELSDTQVTFMRQMADNVMSHLEMVRSRADYGKNAQMLAGLRSFVNDASPPGPGPGPVTPAFPETEITTSNTSQASQPEGRRQSTARPEITRINSMDLEDRDQSSHSSRNISKRFQTAANLIQEAAQFDGVVFFDASTHSFGGLVDGRRQSEDLSSPLTSDGYECSTDTGSGDNESEPQQCRILGAATAAVRPYKSPTEKTLRSLLKRYGHGKLWAINETGDLYSSDDPSEDSCNTGAHRNVESRNSNSTKRQISRKRNTTQSDAALLQRLLPGARSVHFIGLWDVMRQRWFAAAMVWTCSPLRMLSANVELNFVSIFCESLMAEVSRIEAQAEDKAKSDFISSVSHELRSPLHGILGSVEFLHDIPGADEKVLAQVETCCKTLVDIIDHVLDYSKINHLSSQQRAHRAANGSSRTSDGPASPRARQQPLAGLHHSVIKLDHITEEVADTVYHSFCCREEPFSDKTKDIDFILDITGSDFSSHVSVGAWKRVCMNLISNALKYTSKGHVKVTLSSSPPSRKFPSGAAILVVQDTGLGMSRGFLRNHLFRAFTQEDSFAEGLGLGLCLTGKLVKEFRGSIEVQSEKGQGTIVTVMGPLASKQTNGLDSLKTSLEPFETLDSMPKSALVAFLRPSFQKDLFDQKNQGIVESSDAIKRTLTDLGFKSIVTCTDCVDLPQATDLLFVREEHLQLIYTGNDVSKTHWGKPIVILCRTLKSAQNLHRSQYGPQAERHVECVPMPWGPQRLHKAIGRCLTSVTHVPSHKEHHVGFQDRSTTLQVQEPQHSADTHDAQQPIPQASSHITHHSTITEEIVLIPSSSINTQSTQHTLPSSLPFEQLIPQSESPQVTSITTTTIQSTVIAEPIRPKDTELSLLLVDDNSINLQLLSTYAAKQGHYALTAKDGLAAVAAYKDAVDTSIKTSAAGTTATTTSSTYTVSSSGSQYNIVNDTIITVPKRPQVILLDLNMPVMDGFEAARHIRAYEREIGLTPPAKIIALTGLGSKAAKDEAVASGIDLFLTKPVRLKELTKILKGYSAGTFS